MIKSVLIFALVLFLGLTVCSPVGPQPTGSIVIVPVRMDAPEIPAKFAALLESVQCVLKRGARVVYNNYLSLSGNQFVGELDGLQPGSDYALRLYGAGSNGAVIARGYRDLIQVQAGRTTNVDIYWYSFVPTLRVPEDGATVGSTGLTFDWYECQGASAYELQVARTQAFWNVLVQQSQLTVTQYAPSETEMNFDGTLQTYTWRVRAKDGEGYWGDWSEVWSFMVN